VLGLPIPVITQEKCGASAVILSEIESENPEYTGIEDVCNASNTYLRIFGKPIAHKGRRMGVVVCYDSLSTSLDTVRDKCKSLANNVKVK
jgi:phosphoribosylglycinamide formyltransferase 2